MGYYVLGGSHGMPCLKEGEPGLQGVWHSGRGGSKAGAGEWKKL